MASALKILIVDDEPFNLELVTAYLNKAGYEALCATDGKQAYTLLMEHRSTIDIILLDRMMPNMGGMELLKRIKDEPKLQNIPVIMQTAAASREQVVEGVEAGAYYYLTKPFDEETMLAVVNAAANEVRKRKTVDEELRRDILMVDSLKEAKFEVKTIEKADHLAKFLSQLCPEPERALFGIKQLLHNAIAAGNLEMDYALKSRLLKEGEDKWNAEIKRRLTLPEYASRVVKVSYQRTPKAIVLGVKDEGKGFDWKAYVEISPQRAHDIHGRGIAISKLSSFDHLEYLGNGNEVRATINL